MLKGSSLPPRPKAPAPAETSVHLKAPVSAETLGDDNNTTIESVAGATNGSTSTRRLSFADENITHEEPDEEELTNDVEPSIINQAGTQAGRLRENGRRTSNAQSEADPLPGASRPRGQRRTHDDRAWHDCSVLSFRLGHE